MEKVENNQEFGRFQNNQIKIKFDSKIPIVAFDCTPQYFVFGDEKGHVICYEINYSDHTSTLMANSLVASGKVEQLKCHATANVAFVLIGGIVNIVSLPKIEKYNKSEKDIHKFALNTFHNRPNDLVFIAKKKMKFVEYNNEGKKFVDSKYGDNVVLELPDHIEYYKDWINLITKKKSVLTSVEGKGLKHDYDITYSKNVNGSWLVYCSGIGIFLDKGTPKMQNTVDFGSKPLITINTLKNFIVSLHDTELKIFDNHDSNMIDNFIFDSGFTGKFLSVTPEFLTYVTINSSNEIRVNQVEELEYSKQIDNMLMEDKYEKAISILNSSIPSTDEDKLRKLIQFYLDAAWIYFKKHNFIKSLQFFKLTNFNPASLIFLYKNTLKIQLKNDSLSKILSDKNCSIEAITMNDNELINSALNLLHIVLQDRLSYLLSVLKGNDDLKQSQISFMDSKNALLESSLFNLKLSEQLSLIYTTLLKIMVKNKYKPSDLRELVEKETFAWDKDDINYFLSNSRDDFADSAKIAKAFLNEREHNWNDALKTWLDFSSKKGTAPEIILEGKERTKAILLLTKNKDLFIEYIHWILQKYPEEGFMLYSQFSVPNEEIINKEYFYSVISSIETEKNEKDLREKFLEFYIKANPTNETYATRLCNIYIDKLFKLRHQKETSCFVMEGQIRTYYDKLSILIKSNKCDEKENILKRIADTWLVDLEIHLYSVLEQHKEAILKLISLGISEDSFDKLEKYCSEAKPENDFDLFGQMFKSLTELYNKSVSYNSKQDRSSSLILKKQILLTLKKYGDNPKLNPLIVLRAIPKEWKITEEEVFNYLTKIVKSTNYHSNKFKIARSLSEMSVLFKEKELIQTKSNKLEIGIETTCCLCNKRIGSTIFMVYPNQNIYHTKCAPNPNVCPKTLIDFSKKQKI